MYKIKIFKPSVISGRYIWSPAMWLRVAAVRYASCLILICCLGWGVGRDTAVFSLGGRLFRRGAVRSVCCACLARAFVGLWCDSFPFGFVGGTWDGISYVQVISLVPF